MKQIHREDVIAAIQVLDSCALIPVQEMNGKLYLEVNEDLAPFVRSKITESNKYIVYKDNDVDSEKPFYILKGYKNTFTKDIKKAELFENKNVAIKIAELCQGKVKIYT